MDMRYVWVIYFSITFLEMVAFSLFFRSFFENRINYAVTIFLSYIGLIGSGLLMDLIGNLKLFEQTFIVILLCRLFYKASWKQAVFFSMLWLSATWLWDMAVSGLTWRWIPLSHEKPAVIITFVSKSFFILFVFGLKKMFAPAWEIGLYKGNEWRRLLIVPTISVVYGVYCYMKLWTLKGDEADILGVFAFALLLIDVVLYKIVQDMVRERQELQLVILKGQKMQSRIEAYNEMEDMLRLQRKKMHDYKNQVRTIAALIEDEKEKEAESLARQLTENLSKDSSVVDTKNATVNAILNQKYCTAKERGIGMTFVVGDLSSVSLPAVDIIIILGNLLDNAITECEKVKKNGQIPVIRVTMADEMQFVFAIKNPTLGDVVIEENRVVKQYEPGHGLGLSNVWDVTEKYDGSFGISCDGKIFTATVVI